MRRFAFCALALVAMNSTPAALQGQLEALPSEVRNQATVVVSGKLLHGRSPCIPTDSKGSHRWYRETSIEVENVLRGDVAVRYVQINEAMLPHGRYVTKKLEDGQAYLLLLRPKPGSQKILSDREGMFAYFNAMCDDEIVAIVPLRSRAGG